MKISVLLNRKYEDLMMNRLVTGSKKRIAVKNLLMAATLSLAFMGSCFAADLTPTLDKLHEQDPETYPQTSSFTYVDNEDDANTSFSATLPVLNENNEITGEIVKYVNLKQTSYTVDSTPTLDRLHEEDPTEHPETSAYEYVTNPDDANTTIGIGTYTFDKATNTFVETIDK